LNGSETKEMQLKVLIAEDDLLLAESLLLAITKHGHMADHVSNGFEVKGALADSYYDLLLLDLGLPDIDGTDLLKELRGKGFSLPVLILTARDGIESKVGGLELGANDYLTKPFDFRELYARMKTLLRVQAWSNNSEIVLGRLCFHTDSREALIDGKILPMTPKETTAFEILLKNLDRLVTKTELIDRLKDWDSELSENGVEAVIYRLRQKLRSADLSIKTVRGFGYTLEKPCETVDS
jgi:two-component system OmpR family response regulator